MAVYYSTPAKVKSYTGVKPGDLKAADDAALDNILEDWLISIKDLIDQDRKRDYHEEVAAGKRVQIPPGIELIAMKIAANMVAQAALRRDTPIVRLDEYTLKMVPDEIFTAAIRRELSRYPALPSFRMMRVDTSAKEAGEEGIL